MAFERQSFCLEDASRLHDGASLAKELWPPSARSSFDGAGALARNLCPAVRHGAVHKRSGSDAPRGKYRANHDVNALAEIRVHQDRAAMKGGAWKAVKEYFQRANDAFGRPITRDAPVVERFEAIRGADGDDAAFEFLNREAGALHVTPYGLCLNSFAVEPCRKHLECFNNCSHLVRSDDPREVENLKRLRDRFAAYIDRIKTAPSPAPHYSRQLEHAEVRLAAIDAALRLTPSAPVSPDGVSRHKPIAERAAFDG